MAGHVHLLHIIPVLPMSPRMLLFQFVVYGLNWHMRIIVLQLWDVMLGTSNLALTFPACIRVLHLTALVFARNWLALENLR
jgi:hypothetical protein